jgi:outer membrane protein assembly factor BamB
MLQSDSTQRNDERRLSLEKEFGQEKEKLQDSLKTRQQELEELTKRLEELKERAEASEKRLPEIGTAKVLSLGSDDAVSLSWEPPNKSPYAPLTLRGSSVGWAVQSGLVGEGTSPYSGVAAINGRVFVGNGFTQNKLAAYNPSGKLLWEHVMNDPGAGTPVLSEDGETVYVASESCTLYAIATASGTRRWSRVVGPTALTQPSVARNRVLVVARTQDSARANGLPYSLSAINAQDGNFAWIQGLQTDALSAPVIEGGKTYVATRDGMLTVFDIGNGKLLGSHNLRATSAPWVTGNSLLFTSWSSSSKSGFEESFGSLAADGSTKTQQLAGPFPATYLLPSTPDARPDVADGPSPTPTSTPSEPEERALKQALTRSAAQPAFSHEWSYMGARPTVIGEDAYLAVGDQVMNWDLRQGRAKWGLKVTSRTDNLLGLGQGQPPLTPPAYAGGKLYFASVCGDVICMDAASGIVLWRLRLPGSQGIVSQPVLDRGNLYVTTKKGLLVSIDARDPQATGWSVWGGGPGHNGPVTPPPPQKKR